MAIIYRLNTEADKLALVELWSRHSNWGSITVAAWEQRFVYTPLGPAAIVLAVEDQTQEIVAQLAYVPYLLMVQGREVRVYRASAVILNENFRSKTGFLKMQQIMLKLYATARENFVRQGVELWYTMPDPRWSRLMRMLPFVQSTTFPLWSHPLPLNSLEPLSRPYSVSPIEPDDARIDELWFQAAALYPCMVARHTRVLPWKISQDAYLLFGVFNQDQLIGLFAAIKKRKDGQWLLADMLSADVQQSLKATLQAACFVIEDLGSQLSKEERITYRKVAVLSTPTMEPVLRELGFRRDKYDFLLIVQTLTEGLLQEQVAPAQWYVSAND